ncbi:MAG: NAD-dependent dehydratase [Candidatus Liptonbacteria bacterium CG11_big_fil_rev_8_21_14_0_20_35_14]|uniref:UDP-glucuronate decarboxylase n=1 Tax=Candidatus Liptonbacteria bacterium CG11_big_fil_rev_8_21_14_0_20_35_14 TaxID=1974634 RepID=A0A2H0N8P4_9BACT|nr:MAG: NAD-dependent dehydratase [Candidatus Liptonbacteria bacterium CG11_big_fil_rev_8_21_14_0_20_35_14]
MNRSKTILVTGGAGFIGSHLCEKLLGGGNKVLCLDNFFTGSKNNVVHLLGNKNFSIIKHDITKPIFLKPDQIYNLACPASPIHYQKNPIKTIKTSTFGIINMLGMAKKSKARFLQASTSEVYGDPKLHPQKESYWGNVNPIGIRSCYDEGKRVAETLCFDYHREHKVDIRVARIFNTYGPRMQENDGRVVSNFIVQALQGKPITIYGDGSQTRSFCYVDDLVEGLMALMNKSNLTGPVNLGNPTEITIAELAKKVISLTNSLSVLKRKQLPKDDPHRRKPSISIAQKSLKWKPKIHLQKGLQRTIQYFQANKNDQEEK